MGRFQFPSCDRDSGWRLSKGSGRTTGRDIQRTGLSEQRKPAKMWKIAFKKALAAKGEDGMLFCVGSLYLVGEIKTLILQGVGK